MPTDLHLRKEVRHAVRWSLRVCTIGWDEELAMETVDLSRSGAFVRTDVPIEPDTQLQITLLVPERNLELDVFARVVRRVDTKTAADRETEAGVGIEFIEPSTQFRNMLQELLAREPEVGPGDGDDGLHWRPKDDDPEEDTPSLGFIDPKAATVDEDPPTQQLGQEWWKGSLDDLRGELKHRQTTHRRNLVEQFRQEFAPPAAPVEEDPELLARRAEKLLEANDPTGAREIAADLARAYPDNHVYKVLFHLSAGRAAKAKGSLEEAVVHWKQAVSIDPGCAEAVLELRETGLSDTKQKRFFGEIWQAIQRLWS